MQLTKCYISILPVKRLLVWTRSLTASQPKCWKNTYWDWFEPHASDWGYMIPVAAKYNWDILRFSTSVWGQRWCYFWKTRLRFSVRRSPWFLRVCRWWFWSVWRQIRGRHAPASFCMRWSWFGYTWEFAWSAYRPWYDQRWCSSNACCGHKWPFWLVPLCWLNLRLNKILKMCSLLQHACISQSLFRGFGTSSWQRPSRDGGEGPFGSSSLLDARAERKTTTTDVCTPLHSTS